MSKTSDFVSKMSKGEFLTDKRTLSAMKRMGLIYDYDEWGNIKSAYVPYLNDKGVATKAKFELFPKCNANEIPDEPLDSKEALEGTFGLNRTIKYENVVFTIGCKKGCYTPRLVKVGDVVKKAV